MTEPQFEPLSVGQILDRTFSVYKANFVRFVAIVAVVTVPVSLVSFGVNLAVFQPIAQGEEPDLALAMLALLSLVVLAIFGQGLANAALIRAVSEAYLGNEVTVGEAYRTVLPKLLTVVGAALAVSIVVMIGLVLLIVPGVIFMLWLSLTVQAIVIEDLGAIRGMGRSRRLVSGNLGKTFAVIFVAALIAWVIGVVFGFAGSAANLALGGLGQSVRMAVAQVFSIAGNVVAAPIGATAVILLYYDLRIRKEGFDLEALAEQLASEGRTPDVAPPIE